jgi:hypothetical protein
MTHVLSSPTKHAHHYYVPVASKSFILVQKMPMLLTRIEGRIVDDHKFQDHERKLAAFPFCLQLTEYTRQK